MLGLINKAVLAINKSERYVRLASNTVDGTKIVGAELEKISKLVKFIPNEQLKLLYVYNDDFEHGINIETRYFAR